MCGGLFCSVLIVREKGLAFFGLLEDVVTSLGKQVDLLDASEIIPQSPIDMEIKKHGVVIYGK